MIQVLRDAAANGFRLITPPVFATETDSAISRRAFDGVLSAGEAQKAYAILDAAPVKLLGGRRMRRRARQIAQQFNQRFIYDATYAALAQLHGCEFWTADQPFYDAVKAGLPFVRYLAHYP